MLGVVCFWDFVVGCYIVNKYNSKWMLLMLFFYIGGWDGESW